MFKRRIGGELEESVVNLCLPQAQLRANRQPARWFPGPTYPAAACSSLQLPFPDHFLASSQLRKLTQTQDFKLFYIARQGTVIHREELQVLSNSNLYYE